MILVHGLLFEISLLIDENEIYEKSIVEKKIIELFKCMFMVCKRSTCIEQI